MYILHKLDKIIEIAANKKSVCLSIYLSIYLSLPWIIVVPTRSQGVELLYRTSGDRVENWLFLIVNH